MVGTRASASIILRLYCGVLILMLLVMLMRRTCDNEVISKLLITSFAILCVHLRSFDGSFMTCLLAKMCDLLTVSRAEMQCHSSAGPDVRHRPDCSDICAEPLSPVIVNMTVMTISYPLALRDGSGKTVCMAHYHRVYG